MSKDEKFEVDDIFQRVHTEESLKNGNNVLRTLNGNTVTSVNSDFKDS